MSTRILLMLYVCAGTPSAAAAASTDTYLTYSGVAHARHSPDFLYGERHVLRYRAGRIAERVVLYTCADGSPFARKTVDYVDPLAPDFVTENATDGMLEGIREGTGDGARGAAAGSVRDGADATRTVFFRAHAADPEKSAPLPRVPGLVADAGFDEYVRARWDGLVHDRTLEMRFLLPSRLDDYGFQVQHLRSETVLGTPSEVFRLRLAGIWGWFLPGIDVYYDAAQHVLIRYDGLSELRDPDGNNYKTAIDFPPQDRKPATEEALREARRAPLARCGAPRVAAR